MKKSILWSLVLSLASLQAYADNNPAQGNPNNANAAVNTPGDANKATSGQPQQNLQTPVDNVSAVPQVVQPIDCNYKIPAQTTSIADNILTQWSEKATMQSFDFDYNNIDTQLKTLQACFTDQGWKSFNEAMVKSGNIEAIKSQKLTVSCQVDGEVKITENKGNTWKIALPLQVVYQNDKEKLTQLLMVNLTVGRKISGDLGIMQLIAQPRAATPSPNQPTNPAQKTS